MQVLEQMAILIKENPAVTVQEIASRLGYAEEKSVYYWLEKSKYSGIKSFKRAVLTGEFVPRGTDKDGQLETREPQTFMLYPSCDIPVVSGFEPTGEPVYVTGDTLNETAKRLGTESFGYRLPVSDYMPLLQKGDLVIVDPTEPPRNGDLLLIWLPPCSIKVRRYHSTGEQTLLLHPFTGREIREEYPASQPRIVGRIVHLLRDFT